MDYTKQLITTIGDVLADAEEHGVSPTPAMKRLAAYGLLVEAQIDLQEKLTDFGQGVQFTPDEGLDFTFTPEIKRKNGRKNCKQCKTKLVGKQRLFCSNKCARRSWKVNNRETARVHQRNYLERKKNGQKLHLVK